MTYRKKNTCGDLVPRPDGMGGEGDVLIGRSVKVERVEMGVN